MTTRTTREATAGALMLFVVIAALMLAAVGVALGVAVVWGGV